jgi:hypothetical protein
MTNVFKNPVVYFTSAYFYRFRVLGTGFHAPGWIYDLFKGTPGKLVPSTLYPVSPFLTNSFCLLSLLIIILAFQTTDMALNYIRMAFFLIGFVVAFTDRFRGPFFPVLLIPYLLQIHSSLK